MIINMDTDMDTDIWIQITITHSWDFFTNLGIFSIYFTKKRTEGYKMEDIWKIHKIAISSIYDERDWEIHKIAISKLLSEAFSQIYFFIVSTPKSICYKKRKTLKLINKAPKSREFEKRC